MDLERESEEIHANCKDNMEIYEKNGKNIYHIKITGYIYKNIKYNKKNM